MALDKLTTIQTSGIVATGIVTSNSYVGDGSGLTGVVGSGSGVVVQDDTSVVGTAGTIDFGTALDVSAISSGIVTVTASGGSGSIAGIDTTATSIFSTLDIGADIDVDGHTELDNINIAGVTTFAGNIDANADIDIDGHTNLDNVSIAGVTTFSEDVKFTGATSGRDVTFDKSDDSLGFADNAKLKIGNSGDLSVYHDGSNSYISDSGTGALTIEASTLLIENAAGNQNMIQAHQSGAVNLYYSNSKKFETTNTGALVTGILTATSFVGDGSGLTNLPGGGSYGDSDVDTHLNRSSASSGEILSWNGSDYAWVADNVGSGSTAEVRSNTLTVSGVSTFSGVVNLTSSSQYPLVINGSDNGKIVLQGSNAPYIRFKEQTTDKAYIQWNNDGYLELKNEEANESLKLGNGSNGLKWSVGGNDYTIWNSTNMGSGGGLDADKLDNQEGSYYTNAANLTGTLPAIDGSNLTGVTGSVAGISTTGTSNFANIQLIGITTGLNVSGVLTAAQFSGDGANLTSLPAAQLSGTAAAINGSNITNLAAANLSGTLPALDGSALTGIAVTEAPITNFTVTANGSSAYRFAGGGVNSSSDDPDLYLIRGQKYRFNNTTGSNHPFRFRVSSGGSTYSSGVSGSENGVQFFMVPLDAPASLVYQCTIHSGMVGNIYIRGAGGNNTNVGVTTFSGAVNISGDLSIADKIIHTGDTNCFISFPAADQIVFEGGGHERFRINGTTGRYLFGRDITGRAANYNNTSVVPIIQIEDDTEASISVAKFSNNTDSSRIYLQKGRGAVGSASVVQDNDTLGMIVFNGYNGSGFRNAAQILAEVDGTPTSSGDDTDMPGALVFKTSEDGTNVPTERLRITSTGFLGINESDPQQLLHVHNDTNYQGILINGNGAPRIAFARSTTTTGEWSVGIDGTNGNQFVINNSNDNSNRKFIVSSSGVTAAGTITSGGNATFNGVVTFNGGYQQGNASAGLALFGSSAQSRGVVIAHGSDVMRATHTNAMDLGTSSIRWKQIYTNNSVNTSDKNLKHTISDSDLGLSFVNKLRPVSYKWVQKEEESLDTKTHYGLIAQEIETALASEGKTLNDFAGVFKPDDYKDDGTGGAMGISLGEIISPLIKAIQELSAEVDALKAK